MNALSICVEHMRRAFGNALLRARATRICTDGRTNERHADVAYVTNKSSSSETRAHVQNFSIVVMGR